MKSLSCIYILYKLFKGDFMDFWKLGNLDRKQKFNYAHYRLNKIPYINTNYFFHRKQNKGVFNKKTQICQKGLEVRLRNKEIKRADMFREINLEKCFSRDTKMSRRKAKRHHVPRSKKYYLRKTY